MNNRKYTSNFSDLYDSMYGKQVKTVTFIVTHQCNLRCTYCYEHNKKDGKMPLETAKKCVDLLFEEDAKHSELINSQKAAAIILDFIGGEPFLEIDLIDQIMDYFLDKAIELKHRWAVHYMISISTNGTLGDDPKVRQFINKYHGRLSIGVTIDGSKEAHDACRIDMDGNGSYDRAIKMYRAVTNGGRRNTKYTIAPGNIKILRSSVCDLIENEGIDDFHINCVYEEGWTVEHARILYEQLKSISDYVIKNNIHTYISILDWTAGNHLPDAQTSNWCGGTGAMLAFDIDGTILPCMRYSSISIPEDKQPVYRIGDVEHGIAQTNDDKKRLDYLRAITRQSQSTQECLDCPINEGCAWCSAYNYEMTGTPNKRVTYICCMHKARVLAQCYHHNMRHLKDPTHEPKHCYVPREWALEIITEDEWNMLLDLEKKAFADWDEVRHSLKHT